MPNAIKVDNPNELDDSKAMVTPLISMPGAINAMEVNNYSEKKNESADSFENWTLPDRTQDLIVVRLTSLWTVSIAC